jgi:16S rRNA (cytosine1402-N4)-methyltransferase
MEFCHYSVLLQETIEQLQVRPEGIYVDGTLGGGGHSYEIARQLREGHLIGIDQDADALQAAAQRLEPFMDHVTLVRSNYEDMVSVVHREGYTAVDGILLDLGVSSFQLDTPERGFSYRDPEAPLDMRMDQRGAMTAADIINEYSQEELYRVIREYGEERFAKNIAANILRARQDKRIETAGELNAIIDASIPRKARAAGGHPAKRTYQAIRIELNRELKVLEDNLNDFIDLLDDGGRICVITFHSLEDRIVKNIFRKNQDPCTCPKDFPVCVCGKKSKGRVVTRKPILPGEQELEINSRSRSAKLRVFQRKK